MFSENDILAKYAEQIKYADLIRLRRERVGALSRPFWSEFKKLFESFPDANTLHRRRGESLKFDFSSAVVSIGEASDLSSEEHEILRELVWKIMPWRKGPFSLFGYYIDSEWRSDQKWERIRPHLGELDGRRIADFGCGNAYYLLRLLGECGLRGERPECLLGFDPFEKFYLAFELFNRVMPIPLSFDLFGVEQAECFPEFFDLVLCLGVIYHQKDPLRMLQDLHGSLRSGGRLILESQAIPGDSPTALFVPDRYAKARNVYYIPTASCLAAWATRAGFVNVRIVSEVRLDTEEQRQTELAPYESLQDFLDPMDETKTIEGYPAPWRVALVCEKA